jgi:hypothetical protein
MAVLVSTAAMHASASIGECRMSSDEMMRAAVNGDQTIRDVPYPSILDVRPWPLLDLTYGYYNDNGQILINGEQVDKMPALEACSIIIHEIRHHLQNVMGWRMDEVQREIDARVVQEEFLAAHAHEMRGGLGLFAIKQWKREQKARAQSPDTDLDQYIPTHCADWHQRAFVCQFERRP